VIGEHINSWSSIGKSVGAKAKLCKIHVLVSELIVPIVVCESLVQFSGFSEFGGENTQISPEFGANRANT